MSTIYYKIQILRFFSKVLTSAHCHAEQKIMHLRKANFHKKTEIARLNSVINALDMQSFCSSKPEAYKDRIKKYKR